MSTNAASCRHLCEWSYSVSSGQLTVFLPFLPSILGVFQCILRYAFLSSAVSASVFRGAKQDLVVAFMGVELAGTVCVDVDMDESEAERG